MATQIANMDQWKEASTAFDRLLDTTGPPLLNALLVLCFLCEWPKERDLGATEHPCVNLVDGWPLH